MGEGAALTDIAFEVCSNQVSVAGKRNIEARDKEARNGFEGSRTLAETKSTSRQPANSALVAKIQEISVSGRMRGGAGGLELRAKHAVAIGPVSRE